jgi:hypothetical protein
MQLDLFDHCRDVMLRNDVLQALQQRDLEAAQQAWSAFGAEYPRDPGLPMLAALIGVLEHPDDASFADHDALLAARSAIDEHIEPAAWRLFGEAEGTAWLLPLWRRLAQRAAPLAFKSERTEDHAAPLWLRAGDAAAASRAVAGIESWRRIPAPLAWMAEARWRLQGLPATWPLLAELAWLAPGRFDTLTKRLADPVLDRLRKSFDAGFEGEGDVSDLAWFPAWVLTASTALAPLLREAQPSRHNAPEQAMRLLLELLGLERQGRHHELVERRRLLQDLHGPLFEAYMQTR